MTITKLKDEALNKLDRLYHKLKMSIPEKDYVKLEQFLSDQMDKAYEEGKKVQDKKYQSIFNWLSGAKGSFPVKKEGEGNYYWRTPLRKRVESSKQGGKK